MKLKLLLLSFVSALAIKAGATTLTITVQDFSFTPASATIQLGDTVKFTWVNGDHTTTSATIPGGAAAWDQPMTSTNTTFIYVPTVAGVYNYVCTPHAAMGQIGSFTVNGSTGIDNSSLSKIVFDVYPNPAKGLLNISVNNGRKPGQIAIADIAGKIVLTENKIATENVTLNIHRLSPGVYFVRLEQDGKTYLRKFTVTR